MSDELRSIRVTAQREALPPERLEALEQRLMACPDVAFCHLVDVEVEGVNVDPSPTLFVWTVPSALKSLRTALNIVSEAVADSLPPDRYLDVLILNSAPELLMTVEEAGGLFAERDPDERRRALRAADVDGNAPDLGLTRKGCWPF
ncbi:MAG: hypothetical protein PVG92_04225 [Holophagae bacterium]|jgi:hypothetical protein